MEWLICRSSVLLVNTRLTVLKTRTKIIRSDFICSFNFRRFLDAKSWVSILNGLYHKPWGRKSNLNLRVHAQHLFPSTTSEASIKTITVYFLHWYWVWKCWSCTRKFRPFTNSSRGCTAKKIHVSKNGWKWS